MDNKLEDFFNRKYTYVVVGASNDTTKYGFKIVKTLFDNKFNVIPVNLKEDSVYGIKCYKSINDIKEKIDVVDFVVAPQITLKVLEDIKRLNIKKVWFQPGSYNEDAIKFCQKNNISYMSDFCLYEQALKNIK